MNIGFLTTMNMSVVSGLIAAKKHRERREQYPDMPVFCPKQIAVDTFHRLTNKQPVKFSGGNGSYEPTLWERLTKTNKELQYLSAKKDWKKAQSNRFLSQARKDELYRIKKEKKAIARQSERQKEVTTILTGGVASGVASAYVTCGEPSCVIAASTAGAAMTTPVAVLVVDTADGIKENCTIM